MQRHQSGVNCFFLSSADAVHPLHMCVITLSSVESHELSWSLNRCYMWIWESVHDWQHLGAGSLLVSVSSLTNRVWAARRRRAKEAEHNKLKCIASLIYLHSYADRCWCRLVKMSSGSKTPTKSILVFVFCAETQTTHGINKLIPVYSDCKTESWPWYPLFTPEALNIVRSLHRH